MPDPDRPTTPERLRARLAAGPPLVATFVKLAALEVVDLLAATGVDLVVVDLEHSQLDEGEARRLVRHAAAVGLPALVRVPEVDRGAINRLLEAGAVGIQLSTVTSRAQVDDLVAATRYAPAGRRSVSLAQPGAGYGELTLAELVDPARHPVLVGQIETARTADPLAELVVGLDVAFLGLTDLAVDLGELDGLDGPALAGRIAEIAEAASAAGTALGAWVPSLDRADSLGVDARLLTVGSDLGVVRAALGSTFPLTPQ